MIRKGQASSAAGVKVCSIALFVGMFGIEA
jgi:hypothetical protein